MRICCEVQDAIVTPLIQHSVECVRCASSSFFQHVKQTSQALNVSEADLLHRMESALAATSNISESQQQEALHSTGIDGCVSDPKMVPLAGNPFCVSASEVEKLCLPALPFKLQFCRFGILFHVVILRVL